MRIRPAARDALAVPAQQRPRSHEQRPLPGLPRQRTAERSQQRPISLRQLRTNDLTLQDPQLMAEKKSLDLLLPLGAMVEYEQFEQSPKRPVEQRTRDALRPHHDR